MVAMVTLWSEHVALPSSERGGTGPCLPPAPQQACLHVALLKSPPCLPRVAVHVGSPTVMGVALAAATAQPVPSPPGPLCLLPGPHTNRRPHPHVSPPSCGHRRAMAATSILPVPTRPGPFPPFCFRMAAHLPSPMVMAVDLAATSTPPALAPSLPSPVSHLPSPTGLLAYASALAVPSPPSPFPSLLPIPHTTRPPGLPPSQPHGHGCGPGRRQLRHLLLHVLAV